MGVELGHDNIGFTKTVLEFLVLLGNYLLITVNIEITSVLDPHFDTM